jgi:hypothetical protein
MIRLEHINGRTYPFIVCDECGERIRDFKMAIVGWDSLNQFHHFHKVTCDRNLPRTVELGTHLIHLLHNVGLNEAEIESLSELMRECWI